MLISKLVAVPPIWTKFRGTSVTDEANMVLADTEPTIVTKLDADDGVVVGPRKLIDVPVIVTATFRYGLGLPTAIAPLLDMIMVLDCNVSK